MSAALLGALPTLASTAYADEVADATNAKTLDQVSVNGTVGRAQPATTTRLPLTLQETPQSVSVIGLQRLEEQSLFSIDDVMRHVTGVNVSFYDTQRPLYFARGFQITDFQVDGLPTYSGPTNQEYDTVFYDRIEVIRGANGLLTGAGIPSATVNLLRKRPGKDFDASFGVSAGTWDFRRMQADVTAPLTEDGRFRSRLVAAWQDRDDDYDRYHDTKMSGMAVLEGDLTESSTLTVGYQRQDNRPVGSTWGTVPFFAADGSCANLSRSTNMAPEWTRWQRETSTAFANLEQRFGEDWLLRVNTAHTKGAVQGLRVYGTGYPAADGSGVFLRTGAGQMQDTRDSVDVYLSGGSALFGRRHDVVIGGSWQDLHSTTYRVAQTYPADWASCPNAFGPPERCYFIPLPRCRTRTRWCTSMPTTASTTSGPHRWRCAMRSIKPIGRIWITRTTASRALSACRCAGGIEAIGQACSDHRASIAALLSGRGGINGSRVIGTASRPRPLLQERQALRLLCSVHRRHAQAAKR